MPIVLSSEPGRAHLGGSIFCWDRVQRYATSIFDWTYEPTSHFIGVIRRTSVIALGQLRGAEAQGNFRKVRLDES